MDINFLAIFIAAFSSLVMGFIWYHPKVFGTVWMQVAGISEAQIKSGNMAKILGLSLVLAFLLAFALQFLVIHQTGVLGAIGGDPSKALPSYDAFMADYGNTFRTFKHGALHGFMGGVLIALPIIGINALFERKSAKYIFIHAGYWIVTLTIMGAIVCGWK